MYSPKIREQHISSLYRLAQEREEPMTDLVNEAIEAYLAREHNPRTLNGYIIDKTGTVEYYHLHNNDIEATAVVMEHHDHDLTTIDITNLSTNGEPYEAVEAELREVIEDYRSHSR